MKVLRSLVTILVILLATGMFSACGDDTGTTAATGTAASTNSDAEVIVMDSSFDSSSVETRVGVVIELFLEGNPTTGYAWVVESSGEPVLKQKGEPDYQAESDLVGAGGTYTWRFDVVEKGTADLRLIYHQPWDEQTPPDDTFEISLHVKE